MNVYQGPWVNWVVDIYAYSNAASYMNLVHLDYGNPAFCNGSQNCWESTWDGNTSTVGYFTPRQDGSHNCLYSCELVSLSWRSFREDIYTIDSNGNLWRMAYDLNQWPNWMAWSEAPAPPSAIYVNLRAVSWGSSEIDSSSYQNDNHFRNYRVATNNWLCIYSQPC